MTKRAMAWEIYLQVMYNEMGYLLGLIRNRKSSTWGGGYSLGRLFRRRRAGGLGGSGVDGGVGKSGGDEFGRGVMP